MASFNINTDDTDHKTKLFALLDRLRVNSNLEPRHCNEALESTHATMDTKLSPLKSEPWTMIKMDNLSALYPHEPLTPDKNSHEVSSVSPTPFNDPPALPPSEQSSHPTFIQENTESFDVIDVPKTFLLDTESETSICLESDSEEIHPNVRQSSDSYMTRATTDTNQSTAKRPCAAETTDDKLQSSKSQQLPALDENSSLKAPEKDKKSQNRKHIQSSTASATLLKLKDLTFNEYDDAELHGDFQHTLHILMPANATSALLECRGEPIQSIGHQSQCSLSIREPSASPFKDDRVLRICGKAKGICLAQRLVIASIRAYRASKGDANYTDLSNTTRPVTLPTRSHAVLLTKTAKVGNSGPLSWFLEHQNVGKIMGQRGRILTAIRRDTGAVIHLHDSTPGTSEREIQISGSNAAIAAAVHAIQSKAGGRPASKRLGQYFAIPEAFAGCVIGLRGATIQSVTERTGARVQIPSLEDLPLGSVNRLLHVQGTLKQMEHAQRVLRAKLREHQSILQRHKTRMPWTTGETGDNVTIKAVLPYRIASLMLDKRGQLVREIVNTSKAHTHFLAPYDQESRVCVFTGDMRAVFRAQRLVLQVLAGDALSTKRIALPRKRKRTKENNYVVLSEKHEDEEYEEKTSKNDDTERTNSTSASTTLST
ncbi:hypothetical protein CCR75_002180 [Bremia lactucae]|uniref:K Homology domain-containing protein n=1 Tax=Bremia lactucae TaxID=4779 RepID=A0A976FS05_BRELC|nr:hypothetical protein CCR75_002180 [Bremia lactucae]